jgi:hypothetical protein
MVAVSRPAAACYNTRQYQKHMSDLGKLKTLENLILAIIMQDDPNTVLYKDGK